MNSKWIVDLNTKLKLLEENIENLHDLGLDTEFLCLTPKTQSFKKSDQN